MTIDGDGRHDWGPGGGAASDVNLYRSAAATLKTDQNLIVQGNLTVNGTITPSPGATVATTVAGLGTAANGKQGLIRAGSSPYEEIELIYDSTKAKWVSQPMSFGAPAGSVNAFNEAGPVSAIIPNWSALVTAGLSMEVRAMFWWVCNQSVAANGWRIQVTSQAGGNVSHPGAPFGTQLAGITNASSTTEAYVDTGWVAANPSSADHALFVLSFLANNTGATVTWYYPQILVRFVG